MGSACRRYVHQQLATLHMLKCAGIGPAGCIAALSRCVFACHASLSGALVARALLLSRDGAECVVWGPIQSYVCLHARVCDHMRAYATTYAYVVAVQAILAPFWLTYGVYTYSISVRRMYTLYRLPHPCSTVLTSCSAVVHATILCCACELASSLAQKVAVEHLPCRAVRRW